MHKMTIGAIVIQQRSIVPLIDLELIIAHVLDMSRASVIAHPERTLSCDESDSILTYCKKRTQGYPLAYIIGKKEFYGRDFTVNSDTLIPRPETEMIIPLIHTTLTSTHSKRSTLLLDIGTGSGIIAITAALEYSRDIISHIIATDISRNALRVAQENANRHSIDHDITFIRSDLLSHRSIFKKIQDSKCDRIIICANLPYVDKEKKDSLLTHSASRSLQYEPDSALWSSDNGLAHYKKLLTQISELKTELPEMTIMSFFEISPEQKKMLDKILSNDKLIHSTFFFNDLANKPRYAQCIL
jgi:release factor glutamine methyltransferase